MPSLHLATFHTDVTPQVGHPLCRGWLQHSIRTVLASLKRMDPALVEAARTLGASQWNAFWLVTLPLIRPGIAAGMAFAFILSFDDIATVDHEIRAIVRRNWPHLLAKLPPEPEDLG